MYDRIQYLVHAAQRDLHDNIGGGCDWDPSRHRHAAPCQINAMVMWG